VLNDELIVEDEWDAYFEYKPNIKEKQRIQETLFNEKRCIIENCLFGVDINPNSVKICRLRLWIELLKNSYYTKESGYKELETLPNLDINIKTGNSLISRFNLDANFDDTASSLRYTIKEYKEVVQNYKKSNNKNENKKLLEMIKNIKRDYSENITKQNSLHTEIKNLERKLGSLGLENIEMDFITEKQIDEKNKKIAKIENDIAIKKQELDDFLHGKIYEEAFEWRFEFPEILDPDGNFIGFDAVIGNPPYIQLQDNHGELADIYSSMGYECFSRSGDIYQLFYECGYKLLKKKRYLCFITSNKWMRAAYGEKTRKFFAGKANPKILIDFAGQRVFESATVDVNILLLEKKENEQKTVSCIIKEDCKNNMTQ
jgi:hypothetical protein